MSTGEASGKDRAGTAREAAEFTVCEDTGLLAESGRCLEHGGDACLIRVVYKGRLLSERASLGAEIERRRTALEHLADELEGVIFKWAPNHDGRFYVRQLAQVARDPSELTTADDVAAARRGEGEADGG